MTGFQSNRSSTLPTTLRPIKSLRTTTHTFTVKVTEVSMTTWKYRNNNYINNNNYHNRNRSRNYNNNYNHHRFSNMNDDSKYNDYNNVRIYKTRKTQHHDVHYSKDQTDFLEYSNGYFNNNNNGYFNYDRKRGDIERDSYIDSNNNNNNSSYYNSNNNSMSSYTNNGHISRSRKKTRNHTKSRSRSRRHKNRKRQRSRNCSEYKSKSSRSTSISNDSYNYRKKHKKYKYNKKERINHKKKHNKYWSKSRSRSRSKSITSHISSSSSSYNRYKYKKYNSKKSKYYNNSSTERKKNKYSKSKKKRKNRNKSNSSNMSNYDNKSDYSSDSSNSSYKRSHKRNKKNKKYKYSEKYKSSKYKCSKSNRKYNSGSSNSISHSRNKSRTSSKERFDNDSKYNNNSNNNNMNYSYSNNSYNNYRNRNRNKNNYGYSNGYYRRRNNNSNNNVNSNNTTSNNNNISSGREYRNVSLPTADQNENEEGTVKWNVGEFLGDDRRYKIKRYLDSGAFSTVLECNDRRTNKPVAVKVIRSVNRYLESAYYEIDILKKLREKSRKIENELNNNSRYNNSSDRYIPYKNIIQLKNYFELTIRNQKHIIMAFEKLGCSLYQFIKKNDHRGFLLDHIKSISSQIFNALAFCHEECNLVHTDLKLENILLVNDSFITMNNNHVGKNYRIPKSVDIKIIDFGGAVERKNRLNGKSSNGDSYRYDMINTRQYRGPEVILGIGWSYSSDLWSVGCILSELYTGDLLFSTHENIEHLAMMEHILEQKIPKILIQKLLDKHKNNNSNNNKYKNMKRSMSPYIKKKHENKNNKNNKNNKSKKLKEIVDESFFNSNKLCLDWPKVAISQESIKHVKSRLTLRQSIQHKSFREVVRSCLSLHRDTRITARDALKLDFFLK